MEITFQYRSEIQEIPSIRKDLALLQSEWAIPDSDMRQIGVIVEEIFSNIIRFAYNDAFEHRIDVSLKKYDAEIIIDITDDGVPFNPMEYQPLPVNDPAASIDGGMGLTLIKTFSSTISYERIENQNHLNITKRIKSTSQAGE